jgi:hypothetical protein
MAPGQVDQVGGSDAEPHKQNVARTVNQVQVDWGHLGTSSECKLWGFTTTVGYSRRLFAEAAIDQKLSTLLRMHESAFYEWGGGFQSHSPEAASQADHWLMLEISSRALGFLCATSDVSKPARTDTPFC